VLLALFIALASAVYADTIVTRDGKKLEGRITEQTDEYVRLRTGYGDLTIPRSEIKSIELSATKVHLKDGRVMEGIISGETSDAVTLRTKYGELKIPRGDIKKIDRPEEYIAKGARKTPGPTKKAEPPAKKLTPQEIQQMHSRAIKLLQDGNYDESIKLYKQIIAGGPDDPRVSIAYYNLACAYSLKGDKDEALDALEASIEKGYTDFAHMEKDSDLDNVRSEPRYKSLLARREEIQKRGAEKTVEQLKKLFNERYKFSQECMFDIDEERKIIYATNQSAAVLEQLKEALNEYADAQWKTLFDHKPTYYITIVCPSQQDFRKMVPSRGVGGYYNHQQKILVCGGIGMVLRHEFTHALHFGDLDARGQGHPIWLVEGLATCFEESALIDGIPTPLPNGRLNVVRIALATGKYLPWDKLFKYSHRQYMQNASICYAESRYIVYYIWQMGKLKEFYDVYCETYDEDKTCQKAMEKVFGKSLSEVEADFRKWIADAPEPVGATPKGAPFFGVGTQGTAAGMQVVQVVPGSSADAAGIKAGDIIVEFAGKKYTNRDQFATAIREQKAGETIKVKILRGEEIMELDVKLKPRE
jgi:tetratricopeptide (TPR) repeat protein